MEDKTNPPGGIPLDVETCRTTLAILCNLLAEKAAAWDELNGATPASEAVCDAVNTMFVTLQRLLFNPERDVKYYGFTESQKNEDNQIKLGNIETLLLMLHPTETVNPRWRETVLEEVRGMIARLGAT